MTITDTRNWQLGFVVGFAGGLALGVVLGLSSGANAQPIEPLDVDLPITTVIGGAPGSVHHIGTVNAVAGQACVAVLTFGNDPDEEPSIHPGNDILVGPVVFTNVENGTFEAASLSFTAVGPVEVAVRLGPRGIFSAGFLLEVTCNPPSSITTTSMTAPPPDAGSPGTTSTTGPTPAPSTTLSPPPHGGIPAGGGSEADSWTAANGMPWPWYWKVGAFALWGVAALAVLTGMAIKTRTMADE